MSEPESQSSESRNDREPKEKTKREKPAPTAATDAGALEQTVIGETNDKTLIEDTSAAPKQATGSSSKKGSSQLGDFRVLKKLGKGGMGEVYLAKQVSLDRNVALKVLSKELAAQESFVARFHREARAMAKLHHPNIVQVYAAESHRGVNFVAIEYVDGMSMQDWMDKLQTISIGDALLVTLTCADALNHAREMDIVHRDIKPDNILVTKRGHIKVADFGLAKALNEDVAMTQSGVGMGTPLYMSPEQARNAKHVDFRTDIYALGCTLYYLLTGKLPFAGETTLELITTKEKGKFTPARRINREIPERLDLMIDKMMACEADHRYGNYEELISDLEELELDHQSLSFIDDESGGSPASRGSDRKRRSKQRPSVQQNETQDFRQAETQSSTPKPTNWIIQTKGKKGKPATKQMTTVQVTQALQTEILDPSMKAKRSPEGAFLELGKFPEFAGVITKKKVKAKHDARKQDMRKMYDDIEKDIVRRKRWRWLRSLTENTFGMVSLVFYLAILAGIAYALYVYLPVGFAWVASQFNLN